MKTCRTCKLPKEIDEFYKSPANRDGHFTQCKSCCKEYSKTPKAKASQARWATENRKKPERIAQLKAASTRFAKSDKGRRHAREYKQRRYKTDIPFRLAAVLRRRGHTAIKQKYKDSSFVRDCGLASMEELRSYLETMFRPGMTWENFGKEWAIDHMIPLALFDLADRKQFLEACHYTNLQPLNAVENKRWGNRVKFCRVPEIRF